MKKTNKKIQKKIRLNNIIAILFIFGIFGVFTQFVDGKQEVATTEYQVQESDTLWNIAGKICNDNTTQNLNRQNLIIEIKNINNLTESDIYSGQVIKLPIY